MIYIEDEEEYDKYYQNKKKEEASLEICNRLIKETYNLDKYNKITNHIFLENVWLEEKNKTDNIETITDIIIMLDNNNYFRFKYSHMIHLLENYRLSSYSDASFFGSLYG